MKKCLSLVIGAMLFLTVVACGGVAQWTRDDATNLNKKGLTEQKVIQKLGKPDQKYVKDGLQVWEYRRAADDKNAGNTLLAISSFGYMTGKDAGWVDLLRFYFKSGEVVNITYEENVASMMGLFIQR